MDTTFQLRFQSSGDAYRFFTACQASRGESNPMFYGGLFRGDPGWEEARYESILVELPKPSDPHVFKCFKCARKMHATDLNRCQDGSGRPMCPSCYDRLVNP